MRVIKKYAILMVCCVVLVVNHVYANEMTQNQKVIKVGYVEDWGMYDENKGKDDHQYAYEYFREISKYTGCLYEFVKIQWDEVPYMLQSGAIDLFGSMGITDERTQQYEYTNRPFAYENILLTAKDGSDILLDDIEAIDQKRISAVEDSPILLEYLNQYLLENNISGDYIEYAGVDGLDEGIYDLEVTGSIIAQKNRQIIAKLGVIPIYFVANKGNTELIEELNMALEEIHINDMYFELELNQKYFSHTKMALPGLTKEDIQLLEDKDHGFTVLFSPNQEPFQYVDEDGNPSGIAIEIMKLIGEDAGIQFDFVPEQEDTDYGDIDICIKQFTNSLSKHDRISTNVYLQLPMMMVGKSEYNPNNPQSIGILSCHNFNINLPYLVEYEIFDDMVEALNKGDITYIMSSSVCNSYILEATGLDSSCVYPTDKNVDMTMMFSQELGEYVGLFNKLIGRVDKAEREAIVLNHNAAFVPEVTVAEMLMDNAYLAALTIFASGFVIVSIIIVMHRIKKKALYQIINKDELTGLLSMRKFKERAKKVLDTAKPNEYMIISVDIDNFQYINEAYGYIPGSNVLKALALKLTSCYGKDALIAREKDDNFLILATNIDMVIPEHPSAKQSNCNNCMTSVMGEIVGDTYKVCLSKGKYILHNPEEPLEYMMDCAHSARILGKQNYGNTLFEFTEAMREERITKNKIVNSMEDALDNKEFKVHYQPKVELKGKKIIGAEALIRWMPEDGSLIYPDDFIPLFEQNGFIINLDYYVFEEVCRFISRYREEMTLPVISVNLSAITLLEDGLVEKLKNISSQFDLDNNLLEIEITESAIVKDFDEAIKRIGLLKDAGFSISLDDFGCGQSSLNRLKDLQIDILKIDREFLTANLTDAKGMAIIKNVVAMAKEISILTIAEGVETNEHVEFLQNLDCDYAQGYFFGKPMSEKNFRDFLNNEN